MRIDRIRITSLASLHGEQPSIDLTGPILGNGCLIAITGPTGSGKSTLLDGLSLALFGSTPRLGKNTADLLSCDAVEGGAEVAFTLDDGRSLTASWSIRRAHKKFSGAMQGVVRQIQNDLDGSIVASGTNEVKAWIDANLRLTYDQFQSVMLLAQFDFSRFLNTGDNERSQLLEKLTGTDLYAQLSTMAFAQNKAAQAQVDQYELALAKECVLTAEGRSTLLHTLQVAQTAVTVADTACSDALAVVTWWTERQRREEDLRQRTASHTQAQEHWLAADVDRQRLASAEAAQRHQELLTLLDEARRTTASLRSAQADRQRDLIQAENTLLNQSQALVAASAQLTRALRGANTAADTVVSLVLPDAALTPARSALLQCQERTAQWERQRTLHAQKQREATNAITALDHALQQHQVASEQQRQTAADLATVEAQRLELLGGSDFAALGAQDAYAQEAVTVARTLASIDLSAAMTAKAHAESAVTTASNNHLTADSASNLAIKQYSLAEEQKQRAESLAQIAAFAHHLSAGDPCPLCGSSDHPHPAVPGNTLVSDAQQILELARAGRQRTEIAKQHTADARDRAQSNLNTAIATLERAQIEIQKHRARWSALRVAIPNLPVDHDQCAATALASDISKRLTAVRLVDARKINTTKFLQNADNALTKAALAQTAAQTRGDETKKAVIELAATLASIEADVTTAQNAVTTAITDLARQIGEALPNNPAKWLTSLVERIAGARLLGEQAQLLREADDDYGATARACLPVGYVPELPPLRVPDPRIPIKGLRDVLNIYQKAQIAFERATVTAQTADTALTTAITSEQQRQGHLIAQIAGSPFADEAGLRAALMAASALTALRQRLEDLRQTEVSSRNEVVRASTALTGHMVLAGIDPANPEGAIGAQSALQLAQVHRDATRDQLTKHQHDLAEDDRRHDARAQIQAEAGPLLARAQQAATLSDLIGSSNGVRFQRFAQALTLDQLLILANQRLMTLAPRYQLARIPMIVGKDPSLALDIIDQEQADTRRPAATLSGGETFLVSLALALALADLKRGGLRLETLFIDEGFGSLDPATLERCLAILERLQQEQGTQIVIISHIHALHERMAYRIEVRPRGNGRSKLRVIGPEHVKFWEQ